MKQEQPNSHSSGLGAESASFIAAHAVNNLVGLGNSLRLSVLIGIERAIDAGLVTVDVDLLDRTEDGYLKNSSIKESWVNYVSHLLRDPTYLETLPQVQPEVIVPELIQDVGVFIAVEEEGPRLGN